MGAVLKPEPAKRKKPTKPSKTAVILRFEPEMLSEIDAAADAVGISRQRAVTKLLRFALDENKKSNRR